MKLTIDKSILRLGLGRIQGIVERRSTMPILENVLLTATGSSKKSELEVASTDLEIGVRSRHTGDGLKIEKPGSVSVPARKLYDIVRELPDKPIQLESSNDTSLELRSGRAHFTLVGADVDSYPTFPEFTPKDPKPSSDKMIRLQAPVLAQMIDYTIYAASTDEGRYNLNGVHVEVDEKAGKIRLVATDGHRLALVERSIGDGVAELPGSIIIPRKGVAELKRLVDEEDDEDVEIGFEGASGLARRGGVTLVMRLIEATFPNYSEVIPKDAKNKLTIEIAPVLSALRRAMLLSDEQSRAVKLEIDANTLKISASNTNQDQAHEELDVTYVGEPLSVRFNAKYLVDALSVLDAKEAEISLKTGSDPAKLRPTDDSDALSVIMPMRV